LRKTGIAILIAAGMLPGGQVVAFDFTSLGDAGGWKEQPVSIVFDESDYTNDVNAVVVDAALTNAFNT
jgi:hypothetical protein